MVEKLKLFENKYEEISLLLCDPQIASSAEKNTEAMKELKEVEPIVLKYREYKKYDEELKEAKEMLTHETDSELKEMIEAEISECQTKLSQIDEELKLLLLPKDPNDERNVIVEIRGGAGGEEAALFAAVLHVCG